MTRMAGVVAAGFGLSSLTQLISTAVQAGAAIGRLADQAGLSTREFQELQFALRRSGVEGEQLAAAFAAFARNLSDLQRGAGSFLDFLRRSAPQLVEQYQRARNVSEAFELLATHLSQLSDRHDQLRFAQAAGSEQMARIGIEAARLGTGLQAAREEATRSGRVMADRTVADLRQAEQAWKDFGNQVVIVTGQLIANMARTPRPFDRMPEDARNLSMTLGGLSTAMIDASERLRVQAERTGITMRDVAGKLGTIVLENDAIRAAQGQLALFMAQLQALPPQTEFISRSFAQAWERMRAVMVANNETEAAMSAARLNLLRQEDAMRQQLLAGTITAEEQLQRRRDELHQARAQQLISENQLQRALAQANIQYTSTMIGSIGQGLSAMAAAWPKQKAFAIAATAASTIQGVMKAWAEPTLPYPLNAAVAAMIGAAGIANMAKLRSVSPGSGGGAPAVGGGMSSAPPAAAPAPSGPQTAITMNLQGGMMWTSDQVVALMNQMNEHTMNGYVLLSAKKV